MMKYRFEEIEKKYPLSLDDLNNPNVEQASVVQPQKQEEPIKVNTKATEPTKSSCSPPKKNRVGNNNPFFGHTHSSTTRQQQSITQKARYAAMGNVRESAALRQIVREEIQRYLNSYDTVSK